ncbi:type II toxin-antitoxin system RelE/ParE family toxin [Chroococcidiopsis sp. CCALA 051]|mgnify:CR=1 FL=1|uniref:type II toxin-antitoxin system RelE/ParE family toxin n=1 Tax=Chroococcidiopsis sp. CCALA 051 TaxID=869949 RepID=UPI000D0E0883|nr:type II toxin-antitoxin system RelE/ParE family toxin [Chroococcidiopsis sp. CCALA 051]MBE9017342.1 type II toxin-antitoxin system RelE/ParE family toxin [Chroococcidiopsidales cyanobacterium LEGE 13417]PSM45510.1 type II toxin-antitoxin system RelE/ParE family toxin [Chroococcidiopsis sp. CCALA 051]
MTRYVINIVASRDLMEISDYFYSRNIEAGERFFQKFTRKCEQLVAFPNLGRSYASIQPGLRGVSLENYVIFYKVTENGIEIMRVVSGRRDLQSLFEVSEDN